MISEIALSFLATLAAVCLPVTDDVIRAGDIAPAVSSFAAVPPDVVLGYAPAPGATRVFQVSDLERLARQQGIPLEEAHETCFEWRLAEPSEEQFQKAMERALALPEAHIELLETSRQPAPRGEIVFDQAVLPRPPAGDPTRPVVWKGYIEYGDKRRFGVWARVRITVRATRVVATTPIRAREAIQPDQVRLETYEGFPFLDATASELDEVVGHVSRRSLREGVPIPARQIELPLEVKRGETVEVSVRNGAAVIRGQALAEEGGRRGETILVRNLKSDRTYRAEITGPQQVGIRLSEN
jgi:flagella basal body P-ring formation protein FlgA